MERFNQKLTDETVARYAVDLPVEMIQSIDPLFRTKPIYVVIKTMANRHALPRDFPYAHGWAGTQLAQECRPVLESTGVWKGDGFCMIYNDPVLSLQDESFLATCAHEAAHWAEWQVLLEEGHRGTFYRAACHVHHRASRWLAARGIQLSLNGMISGRDLPASPFVMQGALAVELANTSKPIVEQLRHPMPIEFWALFNQGET